MAGVCWDPKCVKLLCGGTLVKAVTKQRNLLHEKIKQHPQEIDIRINSLGGDFKHPFFQMLKYFSCEQFPSRSSMELLAKPVQSMERKKTQALSTRLFFHAGSGCPGGKHFGSQTLKGASQSWRINDVSLN